jgi:hypothetical protein
MENSKKQINHNRNADRLSVGGSWICGDEILICDEMWGRGGCCYLERKMKKKEEMTIGEDSRHQNG